MFIEIDQAKTRIDYRILDTRYLIMSCTLSEDILRDLVNSRNLTKSHWHWITCRQKLSEDFIKEFSDEVDFDWVVAYQDVSEEFIELFQDKINWYQVSSKKLSNNFIIKFAHKLDWTKVHYKNISEDLIREVQNFIPSYAWHGVFTEVKRSREFLKEFYSKIDSIASSWYSKNREDILGLWSEMHGN